MSVRTLNVRRLVREADGSEEVLELRPGANVLLGGPNTGKTMWLRTLDYLLGDTGTVEEALGDELAAKYERARVELTLDGEPLVLERRWKERGGKHKVYVDGRPLASQDFSAFFLEALRLPRVRFPRGSPLSPHHTWTEVSWRMLLRHLYRAEGAWSELVPKQPEGEQHAVLLQLMGAAPHVFSPALPQLAEAQREEERLVAQRATFEEVLAEVARELVPGQEGPLTAHTLAEARARLAAEEAALEEKRGRALGGLVEAATQEASRRGEGEAEALSALGGQLEAAREKARDAEAALHAAQEKEREASQRAHAARLPPPTLCCPACQRPPPPREVPADTCPLCLVPHPSEEGAGLSAVAARAAALRTVEAAEAQAEGARGEAGEAERQRAAAREEVARLEALLAPVREAAAWILPAEVAVAEREAGGLSERRRQLERLERTLARHEALSQELEAVRARKAALEVEAKKRQGAPDLPGLAEVLADAMQGYLNALDARDREKWERRQVSVHVTRSSVQLLVDGRPWTRKLGANLRAYFFLAYHAAWLRLCRTAPFMSPGLVVLDFPANLGEAGGLSSQERYLLNPLVGLLSRPDMAGLQLIAAGRAFDKLAGAHRVDMGRRWR